MRLLADGWQLWRSDVSCVYMHKRSSLQKWWKMCHRYGFWRTKVVLRHPKRLDLRETLPLLGLALIFILPLWWIAPLAYGIVILLAGANIQLLPREYLLSMGFRCVLSFFILHLP